MHVVLQISEYGKKETRNFLSSSTIALKIQNKVGSLNYGDLRIGLRKSDGDVKISSRHRKSVALNEF